MKTAGLFVSAVLGLALSTSANASLIDRGNGLIYDDDLDITWMANANINGLMNWNDAVAWADGLSYGGYDDWRLPSVDGGCALFDCKGFGNELGHLFYEELGGRVWSSILGSADPDLGLFSNIQSNNYWSDTEYVSNTNYAWDFNTSNGDQFASNKNNEFYAWAVRSGDVTAVAVPEPGTLLLLAAGLAGVAGARWRRC